MTQPVELGAIRDPAVQRAFEQMQLQMPPRVVVTTAQRPPAARAGRGATVYDLTLSKPIWSDGTVWRDAAGTAV